MLLLLIYRIISCHQHGFQSMCSCITQLIECLNDWTDSFDNKLGTDAIYLDFAKAFDTVPHNTLKLKLRNAGIRGNVLRWIVSFLTNRRQKLFYQVDLLAGRMSLAAFRNTQSWAPYSFYCM